LLVRKRVKTEWLRLLSRFIDVDATCRFRAPSAKI
jgi:hypothetical protein